MPTKLPNITILRDSREKEGWFWHPEDKVAGRIQINGTKEVGLDAGDYSLEGFEDEIRIERKAGFAELFGNMIPKDNKERFEREMEKLRNIPYKYLLVESCINSDLWTLSVPQFRMGPPMGKVFEWIVNLQQEYKIVPIFAGDCGKKCARKIFEQFIRRKFNEA